jgi:hypothetical protein
MPKTVNLDAEARAEAKARVVAMARRLDFTTTLRARRSSLSLPARQRRSSLTSRQRGQDQADQLRSSPQGFLALMPFRATRPAQPQWPTHTVTLRFRPTMPFPPLTAEVVR